MLCRSGFTQCKKAAQLWSSTQDKAAKVGKVISYSLLNFLFFGLKKIFMVMCSGPAYLINCPKDTLSVF